MRHRRHHEPGAEEVARRPQNSAPRELAPALLGKPLLAAIGSEAAAGGLSGTSGALGDASCPGELFSLSAPLHPLTQRERRAVAAKIQRNVTEVAAEMLEEERSAKERLHLVHIKCFCLLILAAMAVGITVAYLRSVLIPFVLAVFFMFLLEPLLFAMLNPPRVLQRACPLIRPLAERMEESRTSSTAQDSAGDHAAVDSNDCGTNSKVLMRDVAWKVWTLFSVTCCLLALLGTCVLIIYFLVIAVTDCNWEKYTKSPRLKLVLKVFPHVGSDPEDLHLERLMFWLMQGPLFNAIDITVSVASQTCLTVLFLAFLLSTNASFVERDDVLGIGRQIRKSVRKYIRIKTLMAFMVATSVGVLYWRVQVDLLFVFAFATFVLYYIPHVGNTIAILAPLPLVYLDPAKTWGDLLLVFIFPFSLHQLAINLVEPKLLASSLDLHPIIVLLCLAFWTTVWGAVGAILSVPLTAVVRMVLVQVDHPYAQPAGKILKGEVANLSLGRPTISREVSAGFLSERSPSISSPEALRDGRPSDDVAAAKAQQNVVMSGEPWEL